jgi:hypothetical protein
MKWGMIFCEIAKVQFNMYILYFLHKKKPILTLIKWKMDFLGQEKENTPNQHYLPS